MNERGLAGLVVPALIILCWASSTFADSCHPGVALEGPPELLGPIADALRRHGIGEHAGIGCPFLRARVERRGPVLAVSIQEEVRQAERQVADTETAALVIESFARSDISAPLLAARPARSRPAPEGPAAPAAVPLAAASPPATRFAVALDFEAAGSSDGSGWIGAALRGCAQLGPVCAGVLVRVAADPVAATVTTALMQIPQLLVRRIAVDALLGAEWPIHLPRVVLLPGAGFGVGWLHHDAGPSGAADSGGLRAELRLGAAIPLGRDLSLDLGVSLGAAFLGDPTPTAVVHVETDEDRRFGVPLAGPPWGYLRGGVGVRWGGGAGRGRRPLPGGSAAAPEAGSLP